MVSDFQSLISISDISERLQVEEALKNNKQLLEAQVQERTFETQSSFNDLRKAQDKLVESQKMAALGRLVASVAHEINTPVEVGINTGTQLESTTQIFADKFNSGVLAKQDLEHFIKQVRNSGEISLFNLKRAAKLINSFKEISLGQVNDEIRPFEIKQYTQEIIRSLQPEFNRGDKRAVNSVDLDCETQIVVNSMPEIYSQIMINLIMNSLNHGLEDRHNGKISIKIEQHQNSLLLTHSDNGIGMTEEQVSKAFEPFFTTKRNQGSTGLGLYIVSDAVVQRLKGEIECTSELGKGVKFEIKFPVDLI